MDKIYIKVDKKTGMVYLENTVIGRDKENLQQELIFSFENGFILGSPRLEYKIGNNRYHIPMERIDETYVAPIKNILTVEGKIEMQLVVVEQEQDEEIPVFKSNVFYMYCNKSINAQEEEPDDYEYWLDVIQTKLADIDAALEQVDNLNIDATKIGKVATVFITDKDGITKSVEITDGTDGEKGETGPANTLVIGTVVKGDEANASITGDAPNQTLNLVLPKGDKGETGETGQTGATGPANTLTIGTVSKGDNASATITGTSPNQVLNLVLPKGDKGDKGATGPQGNPGANGTNGQDGFSPIATVTQTQSGATISITDKNGTTTANVTNGQDGEEYDDTELRGLIAEKQNTLVSGSNIKTINNQSLLGSGNITIEGGSGGTSDYTDLTNKPQINNVTLSGNKSLSDLGIQPAGNYLINESDPLFISSVAYNITSADVNNWNNKSNFSGSYNDLTNKPTIPDELKDLTSDSTHRTVTDTEKITWNNKYSKPSSGIPSTDLASAVQTSLGKADSALQSSDLTDYELNTNKVTSISSSSTNTEYPSALAVYNYIQSLDASEVSY